MLKRNQKEEIVRNLEDAVQSSQSVVFVGFHGLRVADETKLRSELKDKGVTYKVARKTLLARALSGKAAGEVPELPGEVAVAYGDEALAPAREIYGFGKAHGGILKILGGIFEGKFLGSVAMTEIATIPSREVLLSKIAFLFKSPLQRFATALLEVSKKK